MKEFNELEEIFLFINQEDSNIKDELELVTLFKFTGEFKAKEGNMDEARKAQWEIDFLNFRLHDNTISSMMSGTDKDGNFIEYPSLKDFTDEQYSYLITRQTQVVTPMLKARYSHILWLSPKKHLDYAKQAISAYLELIKIYEKKDIENSAEKYNRYGLMVLNSIRNAYFLAVSIKDAQLETVKSEMIRLVKDFNPDSSSSFALKAQLINLMLDNKKLFKKEDLEGIEKLCEDLSVKVLSKSHDMSIDMLEIGEQVDIALGNKDDKWQIKMAELYEEMSKKREEGTNLASLEFCKRALNIYKKLKSTAKIEELEKRYKHLKDTMELGVISHEFDISEIIKEARKVAESISEKDPETIIKILMADVKLLPTYADLEAQVETQKGSFMYVVPVEIFDRAGNIAQMFAEDDEKEYHAYLQAFGFTLGLVKNHLIREVLFAAIKKGKLTTESLLSFFNKYSWFGKDIEKPNGEIYNWLNLIEPSLKEYFKELQITFDNPGYYPNLVLPIDSLTLKIEGLLRDLCELQGITTFFFAKDKKGRTVSREKDIHALLYEEAVTNLLDKDDLLFLRFLLVEKAGYNLRHDVAHALMPYNSYTLEKMHLLIFAILRLGRYTSSEK